MEHWSDVGFTPRVTIVFWLHTAQAKVVSLGDMVAAVVFADRECPWYQEGTPARLIIGEPQYFCKDSEAVVYGVPVASPPFLSVGQLSAYVKHTARLAEVAIQFMPRPEAVGGIAARVDFKGEPIRFDTEPPPRT